jgi:RNA polymerase sigma-70 factor (ECF subfamily)
MSLDEGFRFAVVLCDLLGFPYGEAAEILGVQEGTIKSRIFRARDALATRLTEAGYAPPGDQDHTSRNRDVPGNVPSQGLIGDEV